MKIIMVLLFSVLFTNSFAKTKAERKMDKTEARNAKSLCLMKDNLMRGTRLRDCIKSEIQKNSQSALKSKNETQPAP